MALPLLIPLALAGAGGFLSLMSGAEKSREAQAALDEQHLAEERIAAANLAYQKDQAMVQAGTVQREAQASYAFSMGDLFLRQKQGVAELQDLKTQGAQALSAQQAAAGFSGVKNEGTAAMLSDQAGKLVAGRDALAKETLDTALATGAEKASFSRDAGFTQATQLRNQFAGGSAYMNLFQTKAQAADDQYAREWDSLDYSFLRGASDLFGGAVSGFNLGSGIYDNLQTLKKARQP